MVSWETVRTLFHNGRRPPPLRDFSASDGRSADSDSECSKFSSGIGCISAGATAVIQLFWQLVAFQVIVPPQTFRRG